MKPISMKIDKSKVHRISIADGKRILVNLVYAEFGEVDYEVLGVFSGETCGGGIFHQNSAGDTTISDDPGELEISIGVKNTSTIFLELEKLRAEFEAYDNKGNLIGFSEKGLEFLQMFKSNNGYCEAYSENASDDIIYDLQGNWNLDFYKN